MHSVGCNSWGLAAFGQILCGRDAAQIGAGAAAEAAAVDQLATTCSRLVLWEGGRVDTRSEVGYAACISFLDMLDVTARRLRVEAASRSYRSSFTTNYRVLFPDQARHYRVDVLEGSVDRHAAFWVNGDKFELSAEALRLAEALQISWSTICALLNQWSQASQPMQTAPVPRPSIANVKGALLSLDLAWANFEQHYIAELIAFEEKARGLLVQAVGFAHRLRVMEAAGEAETSEEYRSVRRSLAACISRLNSVANSRRKGRDDLDGKILEGAAAALLRCAGEEAKCASADARAAARILAGYVVESFNCMREYLHEVGNCLERVDPHLCNNPGLVDRLVDWEESWEVGARYVQHSTLLNEICDCVAKIRAAQRWSPALATMCEDCDAELFLVLPRIVWLCYLADPSGHMDLMKKMLPHHFVTTDANLQAPSVCPDAKLEGFLQQYQQTVAQLAALRPRGPAGTSPVPVAEAFAWKVLVQRAIAGHQAEPTPNTPMATLPAPMRAEAEALMHELEHWSMDLQRHCPEDWNQCIEVLMLCLRGATQQLKPRTSFRV